MDQVKIIDALPEPESLANILDQNEGTGGSPFNVLLDLAKLPAPFPLVAAGRVGKDAVGKKILDLCKRHKIDCRYLKADGTHPTSYTDVMTVQATGQRTFFHNRGANAVWTGEDIDFNKTQAKIFHLGYLLLLDSLDARDKKYGTRAGALLAKARAAGLKTSIDTVSENSDRFKEIVIPALQHADYCIVNEYEAGRTTGFRVRRADGSPDPVAIRHAAGALLQHGVRECVVIHFPEGAFSRTLKGQDCWQRSLKLPAGFIAGGAGAGDAFCAGVLYGLHEGWELSQCLETGVCLAAACLSHPTCTDGVSSLKAARALLKKYPLRPKLKTR